MTDTTPTPDPFQPPFYRSESENDFYFFDEEGTPYLARIEGEPVCALPADAVRLTEDQTAELSRLRAELDGEREIKTEILARDEYGFTFNDHKRFNTTVVGRRDELTAELTAVRAELERERVIKAEILDRDGLALDTLRAENKNLKELCDASVKVLAAHIDEVRAAAVHCHHPDHTPVTAYQELLHYIWLHVAWRSVTGKCTTEQRELWADAVEKVSERDHPGDGATADRWWREPAVAAVRRG